MRGVEVLEILQLQPGNARADEALDGADVIEVFRGEDGEGVAFVLRAAGAADAVDVVFRMAGDIVIDDVRDALDIEPARGEIGGDEHFELAGLEAFERFDALTLRAVRVQDGDGVLLILQPVRRRGRP